MVLFSLIAESASALWANKLRSFLTIVGMFMGVTSVITITSSIEGMQQNIEDTFAKLGANTFMVSRFGFNVNWNEYLRLLKRKKLTRGLIEPIKEGCPDCLDVGAEGYAGDDIKYGGRRMRRVEVSGETPNVLEMRDYDLAMGRHFSWEEDKRRRQVCVIGHAVYEKFFMYEDPIGKKIRVGANEFVIIGVYDKIGSTMFQGMDDFIAMPLATMQKLYKQPGNPVNLVIAARSMDVRQKAIDQVRVVLRSARHVPYETDDDFVIFTPDMILTFVNNITAAFRAVMISIPVLSIVIGGIVIMNIMMISVTERTREIGIRKSLGARRGHIMVQFLYESLILSLLGGAAGVFAGVVLGGWFLNSVMGIYFTPTALAVTLGFGISTAVGLFFGIYPAMKAARFNPIKALGYA